MPAWSCIGIAPTGAYPSVAGTSPCCPSKWRSLSGMPGYFGWPRPSPSYGTDRGCAAAYVAHGTSSPRCPASDTGVLQLAEGKGAFGVYGENDGVIGESWVGYDRQGMLKSSDLVVEAGLASGAAQFTTGWLPKSNGRATISESATSEAAASAPAIRVRLSREAKPCGCVAKLSASRSPSARGGIMYGSVVVASSGYFESTCVQDARTPDTGVGEDDTEPPLGPVDV